MQRQPLAQAVPRDRIGPARPGQLDNQPPCRLIDLETHKQVFQEVLKMLANHGLIDGTTADGTTLEANAAMRSIVRRDTGEGYQEFLIRLAQESGIETPTREDLARINKSAEEQGQQRRRP